MSPPPVIANSSPIIALQRIGSVDLLHRLFAEVLIPPAVAREIGSALVLPAWIVEHSLAQPIGPEILRASLGPGESEAISLALELGAARVIIDERPARRIAQTLKLPVIGTLGVLLACKRRGFIPFVRRNLDALVEAGFRIAPKLHDRVLRDAGEGGPRVTP